MKNKKTWIMSGLALLLVALSLQVGYFYHHCIRVTYPAPFEDLSNGCGGWMIGMGSILLSICLFFFVKGELYAPYREGEDDPVVGELIYLFSWSPYFYGFAFFLVFSALEVPILESSIENKKVLTHVLAGHPFSIEEIVSDGLMPGVVLAIQPEPISLFGKQYVSKGDKLSSRFSLSVIRRLEIELTKRGLTQSAGILSGQAGG